jgi:5'-nucleotidase
VLLSLALFLRIPAWAGDAEFPLTILHTNDVHAHIQSFDASGQECPDDKKAQGACLGGAARLATAIKAERAGNQNPLLLDAGDWFQGSPAYSLLKDRVISDITTRLGYQAMVPGNTSSTTARPCWPRSSRPCRSPWWPATWTPRPNRPWPA